MLGPIRIGPERSCMGPCRPPFHLWQSLQICHDPSVRQQLLHPMCAWAVLHVLVHGLLPLSALQTADQAQNHLSLA